MEKLGNIKHECGKVSGRLSLIRPVKINGDHYWQKMSHGKCPFHWPISFELLSRQLRFYENGACNPCISRFLTLPFLPFSAFSPSLLPLPFLSLFLSFTKISKETIKFRKRRDYSSSFSLSFFIIVWIFVSSNHRKKRY